MPLADYMRLCLTHPQYGYYVTHDPIGAAGDFITAPEISQMFGELIGLWMAAVWQQMGAPENVRVVELGPGRGTLMIDALRAAKIVKDFLRRARRCISSRSARRCSRAATAAAGGAGRADAVARALADVPGRPRIIVANEFIDALPVHQAVKQADGWHERVVEIAPGRQSGHRRRARSAAAFRGDAAAGTCASRPTGSIYEWRPDTDRARNRPARARPTAPR